MHSALDALVTRLQAALPSVKWQRKPVRPSEVNDPPMGCIVATRGQRVSSHDQLPVWQAQAIVVVHIRPTSGEPDTELLDLVEAINAALQPQPAEALHSLTTTLSDQVWAAWVQDYTLGQNPDKPDLAGVSLTVNLLYTE